MKRKRQERERSVSKRKIGKRNIQTIINTIMYILHVHVYYN